MTKGRTKFTDDRPDPPNNADADQIARDNAEIAAAIDAILEAGGITEEPVPAGDGEERTVTFNVAPLRNEPKPRNRANSIAARIEAAQPDPPMLCRIRSGVASDTELTEHDRRALLGRIDRYLQDHRREQEALARDDYEPWT